MADPHRPVPYCPTLAACRAKTASVLRICPGCWGLLEAEVRSVRRHLERSNVDEPLAQPALFLRTDGTGVTVGPGYPCALSPAHIAEGYVELFGHAGARRPTD